MSREHNRADRFSQEEVERNGTMRSGKNAERENGFFNDTDPLIYRQKEMPWHRVVAHMIAEGYTYEEIAKTLGRNRRTIEEIARQPFVRQRTIAKIEENTKSEIKAFLESEVMPSLQAVVAVRNDPNSKPSEKLAAANSVLDRFLGKPTQPIQHNTKTPSEMTDEELRAQIELELSVEAEADVKPNNNEPDISEFV